MTACSFFGCENDSAGVCQECKKPYCEKHLIKGSFTPDGTTRSVYGTYCMSCQEKAEFKESQKDLGSRWKSGAAVQFYILFAIIAIILSIILIIMNL